MKSVLKKILFISLLFVGKLYAQQELLWREAVRNSFVFSRIEDCKAVFLAPDSWETCQRVHYLSGTDSAILMKMSKGKRPKPASYLCPNYIAVHLGSFVQGASYIVPKDILDKYGRALIGRPDNCQFVIPKEQMDCLLEQANGSVEKIEAALGVPHGKWAGRELSRIDVLCPTDFHLRMPTGNEEGVNELWLPGGYLWQGYREAIINQVPEGAYVETKIMINDNND